MVAERLVLEKIIWGCGKRLRVSGITPESILDGPGLRVVLFVQGCPHRCKGCHNPSTWDIAGGCEMSISDVEKEVLSRLTSMHRGVTFSGGEPFDQYRELAELAIRLKPKVKDIVAYSGYTMDQLVGNELLDTIDYLIDGRFEIDKKDIGLRWRGSSNQVIWRKVKGIWVKESDLP